MKAYDLRLGNYVHGPLGEIMHVTRLGHKNNPDYIEAVCIDGKGSGINAFEGIPITPKWLRQLRFENCINGWWSNDEMINFKLNDDGNEIYLRGSDANLANYPIDYVHQLQNLYYALTWSELTITL